MNVRRIIALTVAAAFILVVVYHVLDPEKNQLDQATRARLGGTYLPLSKGVTHYALEGSEDGQVIVLVHGGTIPMFTWDELTPNFIEAGFRVLRYDMYGRGYSDRPDVVYNRALYLAQLLQLLDALKLRDPVDLVGYSFGGAIVTDFAAQYPERVRRLALISPLIHDYCSPAIFRPPILGEFLACIIGVRIASKRAKAMYEGTNLSQRHAALFAEQTIYKGFRASVLSMFRSDALGDYRDSYAAVGKQSRPVLLIWGLHDTEVKAEMITTARRLIPHAEFHTIQTGRHGLVFQNAGEVGALLINFLRGTT